MDDEAQVQKSRGHKQRVVLFYGAVAGLAFSLAAWGYDCYLLSQANAIMPWLQFILGLVPTVLVGMLAAWLTYRSGSLLVAFVTWLVSGLAFAFIASHVSFEFQAAALRFLDPAIGSQVSYPYNPTIKSYTIIIYGMVLILLVVAGLLSSGLMESSAVTGSPFGFILPVLLWLAIFGLAGYVVENNLTDRLRTPLVSLDQSIQYAADHDNQIVDPKTASDLHLIAIDPIRNLIHRPRRMVLAGYDDFLSARFILIDFGGTFARCSVLDSGVNFCEMK